MSLNHRLGFRPGPEPGTILLDPGSEHEVTPGTVHFAVLATLGEVAAAAAVAAPVVPAQLSVQLLRRARSGTTLEAAGSVSKAGRALVFAEGAVRQEGELVARVSVVFARVG